jgi:hypothetical protein
MTASTGPKISSCAIFMLFFTPSNTVGATYCPPVSCSARQPPATQRAPSSTPDWI